MRPADHARVRQSVLGRLARLEPDTSPRNGPRRFPWSGARSDHASRTARIKLSGPRVLPLWGERGFGDATYLQADVDEHTINGVVPGFADLEPSGGYKSSSRH